MADPRTPHVPMPTWKLELPGVTSCPECLDYYFENAMGLAHACASVGIEHGLSTGEMLRRYLDGYHRDGHKSRSATDGDDPSRCVSCGLRRDLDRDLLCEDCATEIDASDEEPVRAVEDVPTGGLL